MVERASQGTAAEFALASAIRRLLGRNGDAELRTIIPIWFVLIVLAVLAGVLLVLLRLREAHLAAGLWRG